MPLINFKPEFADDILSGVKWFTLRERRKIPIKKGDKLYLYTGGRTKDCKSLVIEGKSYFPRSGNLREAAVFPAGKSCKEKYPKGYRPFVLCQEVKECKMKLVPVGTGPDYSGDRIQIILNGQELTADEVISLIAADGFKKNYPNPLHTSKEISIADKERFVAFHKINYTEFIVKDMIIW